MTAPLTAGSVHIAVNGHSSGMPTDDNDGKDSTEPDDTPGGDPTDTDNSTGEKQARKNAENDPPG